MATRFISVLAAIGAAAFGCGGTSANKPPEPSRQIEVRTQLDAFSLRNGARVLVVRDPATDLVHVATRYDVGAIDDPPGKEGMAHLVEHMAFMVRDGERTLGSYLAESALYSNAHTVLDYTHFDSQGLESELAALLRVEAGRLTPGLCQGISDELFAREREVVLNELRHRHDKADWRGLIATEVYPAGHPYNRRVGGTEATVSSITREEACAFMDRFYVPAHVTMIITGNVDKAGVQAALDKTLVTVPGRAPVERTKPPHTEVVKGIRTRARAVRKPYLIGMWSLPPMLSDDDAAIGMAMANLRYEANKVLELDDLGEVEVVLRIGGVRAPVALLIAELDAVDKADAARRAVTEVANRLSETLSADDFEALKSRTMTDAVIAFDSLSARADRYADYLALADGQRGYFVQELERIHSLSAERVKNATELAFAPARAGWIIVTPSNTDGEYTQVPQQFTGMTHDDGGHEVVVDPAEADQPLAVPVSKSKMHRATRFQLDNGLRVVLLPSSSVPTVDIRLVFASGAASEPADQAGISAVAAHGLEMAVPETREELARLKFFYRVGGYVSASVDEDSTMFRVTGLESYIDGLLAGLGHYVRNGTYNGSAIAEMRKAWKSELADDDNVTARVLSQAIHRAVYGEDHAYSRLGAITRASVDKMSGNHASDFRHRHYVAGNGALIITGKFDTDVVEKHVRYVFDGWPAGQRSQPDLGRARPRPQRLGVASAAQPTVSIAIAYPVPAGLARDPAAYAAWRVLESMLSARVSAVRSELAASYGLSADLRINQGPSSLIIGGKVDRRRAGEALKATLAAIADLTPGPAFAVDFALARRALAARLGTTTNSAGSTGRQLTYAMRNELDNDFIAERVAAAAALSQDRVIELLPTLAPARQSVILYGPEADLRSAFTAAGITGATVVRR